MSRIRKKSISHEKAWEMDVAGCFVRLREAFLSGNAVLIKARADNNSREGLVVAVVAERHEDFEEGHLEPLGIIMDMAMYRTVGKPTGSYQLLTQDGEVEDVMRIQETEATIH